jgi:hypothetical protein
MAREFLEKRSHPPSPRTDVVNPATSVQPAMNSPAQPNATTAAATTAAATASNTGSNAPAASPQLAGRKEVCKKYLAGTCRNKQCSRDHPAVDPNVRALSTQPTHPPSSDRLPCPQAKKVDIVSTPTQPSVTSGSSECKKKACKQHLAGGCRKERCQKEHPPDDSDVRVSFDCDVLTGSDVFNLGERAERGL